MIALTTCPHGVEEGITHQPGNRVADVDGVPTVVALDVSDRPSGKCACCKGTYIYDAPLDQRRAKTRCPHCQAITADPAKDHQADYAVLRGGPLAGHKMPTELDRFTALEDDSGHYMLAADGGYDWVKETLPPHLPAPLSPHRKKK